MRISNVVVAAAALCLSVAAYADTYDTFTLTNLDTTSFGDFFSGTVTLDATTSRFTAVNFVETNSFETLQFSTIASQGTSSGSYLTNITGEQGGFVSLDLPVAGLGGYAGSSICSIYYTTNCVTISSFNGFQAVAGQLALTPTSTSSITPEPSSIALLGTGLLGVAGVVKRRFA